MDVYFAGGWWRVDGPTLACVAHQTVELAEQHQRAGKQVAWSADASAPRACNIRASALVLDERTDGSVHVLSIFNLGAGRLRVDRAEHVSALFALRTALHCARESTRLNRERLRHVAVKRSEPLPMRTLRRLIDHRHLGWSWKACADLLDTTQRVLKAEAWRLFDAGEWLRVTGEPANGAPTGKRVEHFRFTRAHDERRAYAIDAVDDAVQVLLSECVRWDVETVAEAEACEEACTVLAEALSWDRAEARAFLQEKAERFAVERMRRASIKDHGFAPGERCVVVNPGGHEDQPEGPGEVLAAWAYSEGGEILHVRQVHCAGRTWDVPVSMLRKPA